MAHIYFQPKILLNREFGIESNLPGSPSHCHTSTSSLALHCCTSSLVVACRRCTRRRWKPLPLPSPLHSSVLPLRMSEEEQVKREDSTTEQPDAELEKLKAERKKKRKRRLLKEAAKADKRGVCYLSRIPPRMDPLKLRQILSQYGEIERIYLTPEDPAAHVHRKKAGGYRGQGFTEGWVEFTNKSIAKRIASMLNGEQIGGKKKSSFYYDLWNIKYLSKFKWDHLTEEIAYKNATREQKLALELSAAKKERDFYLAKVDQSRALSSIDERLKKKRKIQQAAGLSCEVSGDQQAAKVIRQFPQTKPVRDNAEKQKPGLSKDILAGVFGGSSLSSHQGTP